MKTWQQCVGSRIVAVLNKTLDDARYCKVNKSASELFEVYDGFTRFPVNLNSHTCDCKA